MTLEHATTKISGFRFTLADSLGVFYEGRAAECVTTQRRPDQDEPNEEVSNGVKA